MVFIATFVVAAFHFSKCHHLHPDGVCVGSCCFLIPSVRVKEVKRWSISVATTFPSLQMAWSLSSLKTVVWSPILSAVKCSEEKKNHVYSLASLLRLTFFWGRGEIFKSPSGMRIHITSLYSAAYIWLAVWFRVCTFFLMRTYTICHNLYDAAEATDSVRGAALWSERFFQCFM